MLVATAIFSSIGCLFFVILVLSYKKLLQHNESGFLHLLSAFMFTCWLPLPLVSYLKLSEPAYLLIGTIFGTFSIAMFVITMVMQAGHLAYSARQMDSNPEMWEARDNWMLFGLLGGPYECFAGMLKGIWIIFLTLAFWQSAAYWIAVPGTLLSILSVGYLVKLLDSTTVKDIPILKKIKFGTVLINLETVLWFGLLDLWFSLQI
jgi:hypothetical protein